MAELRERDIVITYTDAHRPHISSTRTTQELALHLWYDWDDHLMFNPDRKFVSMTVDGHTFRTLAEIEGFEND